MSRILPKTYYGEIYTELEARAILANHHFTYKGHTGTVAELMKHFEIQLGDMCDIYATRTLMARIQKGQDIDEILETPYLYPTNKEFDIKGFVGTIYEIRLHFKPNITKVGFEESIRFEVPLEEILFTEKRQASPERQYTIRGKSGTADELYLEFQDELSIQYPTFVTRLKSKYSDEDLFLPPSAPRFPKAPKAYPKFISPDGVELFVESESRKDGHVIYNLSTEESNDAEVFQKAVDKMMEQVVVEGEILRLEDLYPELNGSDRLEFDNGKIANTFTYSFPMHLLRVLSIRYLENGARRPRRTVVVDPNDLYEPL